MVKLLQEPQTSNHGLYLIAPIFQSEQELHWTKSESKDIHTAIHLQCFMVCLFLLCCLRDAARSVVSYTFLAIHKPCKVSTASFLRPRGRYALGQRTPYL